MGLIDPSGKPVDVKSMKAKPRTYKVGNVRVETPETPELTLGNALANAQQAIASQAAAAAMHQGAGHAGAQQAALKAMGQVVSPFQVEPCAQAVFMLLAQEIEWRDQLIDNLNERLRIVEATAGYEVGDLPERPKVEPKEEIKEQRKEEGKVN